MLKVALALKNKNNNNNNNNNKDRNLLNKIIINKKAKVQTELANLAMGSIICPHFKKT